MHGIPLSQIHKLIPPERPVKNVNSDEALATAAATAFAKAAMEKGDFASPASADKRLHAAMARSVEQLDSLGPIGFATLRELLGHDSPHVRKWVAAELLSRGDTTALPILEELVQDSGLLGMASKFALQAFQCSQLRSPFGSK